MKNNEKVISYISNFQTDIRKVPYPTHQILKTMETKYGMP